MPQSEAEGSWCQQAQQLARSVLSLEGVGDAEVSLTKVWPHTLIHKSSDLIA